MRKHTNTDQIKYYAVGILLFSKCDIPSKLPYLLVCFAFIRCQCGKGANAHNILLRICPMSTHGMYYTSKQFNKKKKNMSIYNLLGCVCVCNLN